MKTRLILFVCALVVWLTLCAGFTRPVSNLARQQAAVASIQNSDAAYVTQQAVEHVVSLPWCFAGIVVIAILFWAQPLFSNHERS